MATGGISDKLSAAQKRTLNGSEYILSLYARGSALNYPVVILRNTNTKVPLFIEQINWSTPNNIRVEVFSVTNIATPVAAALSSIKYFNKRFITGNVSTEFFGVTGEITPAQYTALVYGEDLYTKHQAAGIEQNTVLDFSQSNIMLQADPATNASQSIAIVGALGGGDIFASFDICQVDYNTNKVA